MRLRSYPLLVVVLSLPVQAAQLPAASQKDARIRYVNYRGDDVTLVRVQRGTATRIVLGSDEHILADGSATGFAADCSKPELEWCIRADSGTNHILVKPKDGATHNNLELKTDKRDYSFAFRVLPDAGAGAQRGANERDGNAPMFRVVFRYPLALPPLHSTAADMTLTSASAAQPEGGTSRPPASRNWRYSMQILKGAHDIAPSLVFDDGRFTYFRFPANREMPAIFHVAPSGEEARVNHHIDEHDDALVVVERMSRRFVLRLGGATVGIWNDAFDPDGVAPKNGTTVDGVMRALRAEPQP